MFFPRIRICIYLIIVISMSACDNGVSEKPTTTKSINSENNGSSESPYPIPTLIGNMTITPKPINPPLFTNTPITPKNTSTATLVNSATSVTQTNCPNQIFSQESNELNEGITLFSFQGPSSPPGIWGLSSTNSTPFQVTDIDKLPLGVILSADKTQLAWIDHLADPRYLIIFDLRTSQIITIPINPQWRIVEDWTSDGKIKILTNTEELQTIGITNTYELYDPVAKNIKQIKEEFKLPGLQLDTNVWWRGFASIDPSRNIVFYTAINGYNTDFVLINTKDNIEIWRYATNSYQDNIPIARWTKDGSNVTFVAEDKQDKLQHIFNLEINSQKLSEITNSPDWIRQLSWTDDSRYLLASRSLGYWNKGPGFIIDPQTGKQREICAEGFDFGRGDWIENTDLLLYTMYSETNTKVALLNATTWESQDIFVLGPDIFINYIGWTPFTSAR